MVRGDFVWTWFDTGGGKQGGNVILFGRVIAAGPKVVRILWESGLTNRVRREDPKGVFVCHREKLDERALAALEVTGV